MKKIADLLTMYDCRESAQKKNTSQNILYILQVIFKFVARDLKGVAAEYSKRSCNFFSDLTILCM